MGQANSEGRDRLRDLARGVFEPRSGRRLADEDVREIGENLVGFFGVLGEWAGADAREPAPPPGGEVPTEHEGSRARHRGGARAPRTTR